MSGGKRSAVVLLIGLVLVQASAVQAGRKLKADGNGNANPPGRPVDAKDPFESGFPFVEDELLVVFKAGTDEPRKGKALGKGNAEERMVVQRGDAASGDVSLVKVKMLPDQATKGQLTAAAARIQDDEDVELVEPNFIYTTSQATNDPGLNQLWGMLAGTAGANAVGAWASGNTDCSDVVIGVIDTGIQFNHPDLLDHMWVNPVEIPGNGKDDDGNTYIDDIYGYDFVTSDGTVFDDPSVDSHGTHCAGTIGAVGNNGRGVVGVCQSGLKMISAKFLGSGGGTTANAIRAVNYLTDLKTRHKLNIVASSNSWGGGGYSGTLYNAIAAHGNAGILFIAAAGNSQLNMDVTVSYPAGYALANVISVGSITSTGAISSFSNYGQTTVDLFAPGSSIYSTYPTSTYATLSGTSMATPHVSGAAALYAAAYKRKTGSVPTFANIKEAIMNTGVAAAAYTTTSVSGKRLNVANLLNSVPELPPNPVPSPSPELPSPSPEPQPLKQMIVGVTYAYAWGSKNATFSCRATIRVTDAATNAILPGWTATWSYAVDPDISGITDTNNFFPSQPVMTNAGTVAGSNSIPTRSGLSSSRSKTVKNWWNANGSTYTGAACVLSVSVSAAGYETTPAANYVSARG